MPTVFCSWCPCPENTSGGQRPNQSTCKAGYSQLKKAQSEVHARQIVYNHLVNSPFHNLTPDEADQFAKVAEVEKQTWDTDDEGDNVDDRVSEAPMPAKRKREHSVETTSTSAADIANKVAQGVEEGVALALAQVSESTQAAASSHLPHRKQTALVQFSRDDDMVKLRATEVRNILESLDRSKRALKSAQELCASAANAFWSELQVVESAHRQLSAKLD